MRKWFLSRQDRAIQKDRWSSGAVRNWSITQMVGTLLLPPGHCAPLSLWPFPAGGAGGKGVWGRSGEVYEPEEVDKKDPNYDDAQVSLVYFTVRNLKPLSVTEVMLWQENCVYETLVLPLDERDFEKTVTPIVQEYFEHADTKEVAVRL